MRHLSGVLLIGLGSVACGNDVAPPGTGEPGDGADGGTIGTSPSGDAGVPEHDATVELTECQEAPQHADLTWIQQKVFTPSCATAMCHAGADPDVGLNLEAGRARASLVNRNASTATGWIRVTPGDLSTSYLMVALGRVDGPPPRDGFMPLGADSLCVEKLEAVERWILAGAQP
jgi:hypothetical protein